MKTIKIAFTIIAALVLSFGCNEETYLDLKPHTPTDYAFYTSEEGALQGINAAYDILQMGQTIQDRDFYGTVCSGDAMAGGEPGGNDQPSLQEIMKFSMLTTNSFSVNYWNYSYTGIYRCNLILNYLSEPIEGFDETLRQQILGEAEFLRAFFHFKLQINYGGYPQLQSTFNNELKGVPYIDRLLLKEEWYQERPELDYTWSKIEADFIDAAEKLPTSYNATNTGKATQGAAYAMLAKTYLYQEKWQEAYDAAKKVIDSGNYWLIGEDGHNEPKTITRLGKYGEFEATVPGYKWIWTPEANNCAESVFSIQQYQEGTTTYPEGQEGNLMSQYYGPRAVKTMRYNNSSSSYVEVVSEYFWGFILPTKYFVETAFEDIGCEVDGKIVDPRFKIAVVTPEDKVPYYYNDETLREMFPDSVYIAAYHNNPATGNVTMKYYVDPIYNIERKSLGDYPMNNKYLRFSDLLLMSSEAAIHIGKTNDAITWTNRVRNRARNAGITGYPQDLSSITLEDVYAERRVELAFENHQFYDIVRTGRAQKVLIEDAMQFAITTNETLDDAGNTTVNTVQEQFGDNFILGKSELWAIPQTEIDNTNGIITQNPGY